MLTMAEKHLRGGGQIFKRRLGEKAALEYLKRQICFTSSSPVEKNVKRSEKYSSHSSWVNAAILT